MEHAELISLLGSEADALLTHVCTKIAKEHITVPGADHVARVFESSDRSPAVQESLKRLYDTGALRGTGYLSIFPVDQAIEHSAAFSFFDNPIYFDPENIIRFALEAGCNGVASTLGVLGLYSQRYADKVPFILKVNHNELVTYPPKHDQIVFATVNQAKNMGAVAIGATIYFGSPESNRQLQEVSRLFEAAHAVGMATILWCYPRSEHFVRSGTDYSSAADLTAQANHLGVTIEADIIKQKLPTPQRAFIDLKFGKATDAMYDRLLTNHPIDLVRYQVAHCYMGKISLINSGGESQGEADLVEAVRTAVINKRGGGAGLIMGRKLFKRPFAEGLEIVRAVQAVYLDSAITVA